MRRVLNRAMVRKTSYRYGTWHANARAGTKLVHSKIRPNAALTLHLMLIASQSNPATMRTILEYIRKTWTVLVRSNENLARAAAHPKYQPDADGRWPVFVSEHENLHRVEEELQRSMGADFEKIQLQALPHDALHMTSEGLDTCQGQYVVPAAGSTKCMAGIAFSSKWACCATGNSRWRRTWPTISFTKYASTEGAQREPHILSDALAAAVPDADGAGDLRAHPRREVAGGSCRPSKSTIDTGRANPT